MLEAVYVVLLEKVKLLLEVAASRTSIGYLNQNGFRKRLVQHKDLGCCGKEKQSLPEVAVNYRFLDVL